MSAKDPQEHLKTYERFCAPRFTGLEEKVDEINIVVNDGLKDSVQDLKTQYKWLLGLIISLLLLIIGSTITLYVSGQGRLEKYKTFSEKVMEETNEISN